MSRHRVVVIGSGFGGLTATKALKNAPVDVTMIARTQHHLFQPLLYQVATGILSEGEIAPATRRTLRNQRNAEVLLGDVVEINLAGRYVVSELLGQRYQTAYDSLIVAAGAGQSYFGNDHFAEFAPGMKTIDDALEVRGRILGAFELAELSSDPALREKLLTFTVVGARSDRGRIGGPDRRAGRPNAERRIPPYRLDAGAGDPARCRVGGAGADGRQARNEGAGAAAEDGRRDTARG